MSRPKFQSRAARAAAELGTEPWDSPWSPESVAHWVARFFIGLPDDLRPYFDFDTEVRRRFGWLRHIAYLERHGGNLETEAEGVVLMWSCCGSDELIHEVHYDRHGNLRPEEVALIRARAYYHRCDA